MVREGDPSVAVIRRICKKAGAERVSDSASEELARYNPRNLMRVPVEDFLRVLQTEMRTPI